MTLEQFWTIVEEVHRRSGGDMEAKCKYLDQALRQLSFEQICSFDAHLTDQFYRAYDWGLWAAAYIIGGGGCSDDSFMDFRFTLISNGRETFENALANPESLADVDYDAASAHYEGYQYVSSQILEEKSGDGKIPETPSHPKNPTGRDWPENKVGELYPKLAAKYDYKD